jgi:hypothetical protein
MRTIACISATAVATLLLFAAEPRHTRYINPLSIEDTRSIADPTAIKFHGKYYLFLSGGMVWSSDDLVDWVHHPVQLPGGRRGIGAPNVFEYQGQLYLTGNDTGLYRAASPEGPWEYIGDIKDAQGAKMLLFDSMGFVDQDGRVYMYYSGRHTDGIYGVELDRHDLTRFAGPPKKLWTFDPSHVWERYGDNNEGTSLSWLEAPWMTKRNGTYYLQYSAPGTEWKTYAVGVYTSRNPLGPFKYAPVNPILVHKNGLINGTGHHSVVEGPNGNLWAVYTILYRNWGVFDRRIGMDPVGFDAQGNMFIAGPSETPQLAPGANNRPWNGNASDSIAVSINRYTWSASSAHPGRGPDYAFDNNVRTWWQPAAEDRQPWLMLDLGCRNPTDPNQEFNIDSTRILFDTAPPERQAFNVDGHSGWFPNSRGILPVAYRYKIETSLDNHSYLPAIDRTTNARAQNVEFAEFSPARCRYVKLSLIRNNDDPAPAVLEFTVFGKPAP